VKKLRIIFKFHVLLLSLFPNSSTVEPAYEDLLWPWFKHDDSGIFRVKSLSIGKERMLTVRFPISQVSVKCLNYTD
jgi:hypothetical protein